MPRISEERRTEEKERQKERKRKREKETFYRCVCISICTFSQSLAPLFLLSLHMWVSLSLSLSLSLCVCVYECGRVLVCCPLLIPFSFLSQSLSQTYTHKSEELKDLEVKLLFSEVGKRQRE
jgi:hypothetical protein